MSRLRETYKYLFSRGLFYKLNHALFVLSTRGIGILNYENSVLSGENFVLKKLSRQQWKKFVCIDVGANCGLYSQKVKHIINHSVVYSIEPHPEAFYALKLGEQHYGYHAFNMAFSDEEKTLELFDRVTETGNTHSHAHASVYADVIDSLHKAKLSTVHSVEATTVDAFLEKQSIEHVNFLKIDVEGHEHSVLLGAMQSIKAEKIDFIQFEFNQMNTVSRVFMRDFFKILSGYKLYRMLQDFLAPLNTNETLICELFAYQNILAIRNGVALK